MKYNPRAVLLLAIVIGTLLVLGSLYLTKANITQKNFGRTISGPILIQEVTPILKQDGPSAAYASTTDPVATDWRTEASTTQKIAIQISTLDPDIASRHLSSWSDLFYVVSYIHAQAGDYVLYIMTPTGTSCSDGQGAYSMGPVCDNAKIKILNLADNSIHTLSNGMLGLVFTDSKNNSLIISQGSSYNVYDLRTYTTRLTSPPRSISFLSNEYGLSYSTTTHEFLIRNFLNDKSFSCTVTDPKMQTALKGRFDYAIVHLSSNGQKLAVIENYIQSWAPSSTEAFVWNDLSALWSHQPGACLTGANEVQSPVLAYPNWYNNAAYFGIQESSNGLFIYDFQQHKSFPFSPLHYAGAGYIGNLGYYNTADIGDGRKIVVVPGEKQTSIYFVMPDGKGYLIKTYEDDNSTQAFYDSTKQYPINSEGSHTSGYLARGFPLVGFLVTKDTTQSNIYHLAVSGTHPVILQLLDVSVLPFIK